MREMMMHFCLHLFITFLTSWKLSRENYFVANPFRHCISALTLTRPRDTPWDRCCRGWNASLTNFSLPYTHLTLSLSAILPLPSRSFASVYRKRRETAPIVCRHPFSRNSTLVKQGEVPVFHQEVALAPTARDTCRAKNEEHELPHLGLPRWLCPGSSVLHSLAP